MCSAITRVRSGLKCLTSCMKINGSPALYINTKYKSRAQISAAVIASHNGPMHPVWEEAYLHMRTQMHACNTQHLDVTRWRLHFCRWCWFPNVDSTSTSAGSIVHHSTFTPASPERIMTTKKIHKNINENHIKLAELRKFHLLIEGKDQSFLIGFWQVGVHFRSAWTSTPIKSWAECPSQGITRVPQLVFEPIILEVVKGLVDTRKCPSDVYVSLAGHLVTVIKL